MNRHYSRKQEEGRRGVAGTAIFSTHTQHGQQANCSGNTHTMHVSTHQLGHVQVTITAHITLVNTPLADNLQITN